MKDKHMPMPKAMPKSMPKEMPAAKPNCTKMMQDMSKKK